MVSILLLISKQVLDRERDVHALLLLEEHIRQLGICQTPFPSCYPDAPDLDPFKHFMFDGPIHPIV